MTTIKPLFDLNELAPSPLMGNGLTGQDILSVSQFDRDKLS